MGNSADLKVDTVQANQNEQLYDAVKYSSLGSIVAAYVLFSTFEVTPQSYFVCGCLMAIYTLRWLDSLRFKKDSLASRRSSYWHRRFKIGALSACLLYTSPSPRDKRQSRMPSSA